jgi:hypothetical protein
VEHLPLGERIRALVGTERGTARKGRPVRLEPIRRSWVAAWWQARISVRAGVALDDFLRSRLARYLAGLPVPRGRLPLAVEVDDGSLSIHPSTEQRPVRPAAAAAPGGDAWLDPLVELEGPAVRQEIWELEARIAGLDGRVAEARAHADERSRRLAADLGVGAIPLPAGIDATAEQLGRPPVRSGRREAAILTFGIGALAAVTWEVGLSLLRVAGIDAAALLAEAARRPVDLAFVAVFALGVAVALFLFAQVALGRALDLFRGDADARQRRWLAAASAGASAAAIALASAMALVRPEPGGTTPGGRVTWALVFLLVPAATAILLRTARVEADLRAVELEAALAWDRERARALAERARRLEELAWAEEEVRDLARQRDAARRRLRDLEVRAISASRVSAEAERRERASLSRLAETLVGALELDRYEFVRQATARGAPELLAAARRKPEARPRVEAAASAEGRSLVAS